MSSEVERLLKKAKELREQASRDEQELHSQILTKKQRHMEHIDNLIQNLFDDGIHIDDVVVEKESSGSTTSTGDVEHQQLAERLKLKKVSKDTLEKIIERLDDKLMVAEGMEHVTTCASTTAATATATSSSSSIFERVSKPRDTTEIRKVTNQIDCLLNAVQVLDDEFRTQHASTVTGSTEFGLYSTTATEHTHWGGGHLHDDLNAYLHEKQRERHEQFLKRQQEFIDAQTIQPKDQQQQQQHKKAKDDHGYLP